MHINKYLLGISSVAIIGSIGWLSAGTLNISNSNFAKGFPIFKTIFFRSEGKDSINGSTNPEGVRVDNIGIYTAVPNGLPGGGGNVLKLNGANQIYMDPVENGNLANDSISNIKITNNSIVNSNFADLAITNTQIQNNSIEIVKFDPGITWPSGGTMFITNNVCTTPNAIVSVNNGTATCAALPSGATATLPSCSAGQQPVFSGGVWGCQVLLLGSTSGDPYRTGTAGGSIANSNIGDVGVGTNNPTQKLTVSGSLEILGTTEDQVYCYATDTWVPLGTYNQNVCAGCNAGFSYNPSTLMCEQVSCLGTCNSVYQTAPGTLTFPANRTLSDSYRNGGDGLIYVNGMLDVDLTGYDIVIKNSSGLTDLTGGSIVDQATNLSTGFSGSVTTPPGNYMVEIREPGLPSCVMYRYNF